MPPVLKTPALNAVTVRRIPRPNPYDSLPSLIPESSQEFNSFRCYEQRETEHIDPEEGHFSVFRPCLKPMRDQAI